MRLYRALNRTPLASTYRGKLFAAIIIGALVVPLALLAWSRVAGVSIPGTSFAVMLGAVAAGTLVACLLVHALLAPIEKALEVAARARPEAASGGKRRRREDLAGRLLSDVAALASGADERDASLAAVTDPLTGLHNRHWCQTRLSRELVATVRQSGALVLALIKLDRLGRIRSEHGRDTADVCLQRLAEVGRASLRTGDWIARWDDAEFVAVLRGGRGEAEPALERLREMLARRPVTAADNSQIELGVSIGAVTATGGEALDALFRSADKAVGHARSAGQDRIAFFGD